MQGQKINTRKKGIGRGQEIEYPPQTHPVAIPNIRGISIQGNNAQAQGRIQEFHSGWAAFVF